MRDKTKFGKLIGKRAVKQAELARRVGISGSTVSRYVNSDCSKMSITEAAKIAEILEIDFAEFCAEIRMKAEKGAV